MFHPWYVQHTTYITYLTPTSYNLQPTSRGQIPPARIRTINISCAKPEHYLLSYQDLRAVCQRADLSAWGDAATVPPACPLNVSTFLIMRAAALAGRPAGGATGPSAGRIRTAAPSGSVVLADSAGRAAGVRAGQRFAPRRRQRGSDAADGCCTAAVGHGGLCHGPAAPARPRSVPPAGGNDRQPDRPVSVCLSVCLSVRLWQRGLVTSLIPAPPPPPKTTEGREKSYPWASPRIFEWGDESSAGG